MGWFSRSQLSQVVGGCVIGTVRATFWAIPPFGNALTKTLAKHCQGLARNGNTKEGSSS